MSDPKHIKEQTTIKSGDVKPEDAAKKVEELKEEELGKVTGGMYPDWKVAPTNGKT